MRKSLIPLILLFLLAALFLFRELSQEETNPSIELQQSPASVAEVEPTLQVTRETGFVSRGPLHISPRRNSQLVAEEGVTRPILYGHVNDLNGHPIPGAEVLLQPAIQTMTADPSQAERLLRERALGRVVIDTRQVTARVRSDADGYYAVSSGRLSKAVYQIVAQSTGLAPQRLLWAWTGQSEELNFFLGPGGQISGTVLDSLGQPIEGARVRVLTQGDEGRGNWSGEFELVGQTTSLADGSFHLDVCPGTFQVWAKAAGYIPSILRSVREGRSDLELVLSSGWNLEGRVEDQYGEPVSEANVSLWPHKAGVGSPGTLSTPSVIKQPLAQTSTDSTGNFRFEDLPGESYNVLAGKEGYVPTQHCEDLRSEQDPHGLVLRLLPGQVLFGKVSDEDQRPVTGALVTVTPSRGVEVDLTHQPIPLSQAVAAVETDSEGNFQINTLEVTEFDLSVVADNLLPVRLDKLDLSRNSQPVNIVLEKGAGLKGRVVCSLTGRGITEATLVLGRVRHRRIARTDSEGAYRVSGLLEGVLDQVRVQAEGYGLKTLHEVEVVGSVRELDIELDPAARVEGTVSTAAGGPVSGAWVHIQPAADSPDLYSEEDEWRVEQMRHRLRVSTRSDATGHFELANVNPGASLGISVRCPGYRRLFTVPFPVAPGEQMDGLELTLIRESN